MPQLKYNMTHIGAGHYRLNGQHTFKMERGLDEEHAFLSLLFRCYQAQMGKDAFIGMYSDCDPEDTLESLEAEYDSIKADLDKMVSMYGEIDFGAVYDCMSPIDLEL